MSSERIKLVCGDTGPQIRFTLTDPVGNQPVDLTGATVTLRLRAAGTTTTLVAREALIVPGTAAQGVAVLDWAEGDLDHEPGDYEGELELVRATGTRETVYELLRIRLREDFA